MPKFHYIYLAQNLLKTRFSTRLPTCFEQVADMSQTSHLKSETKKVADLVADLVSDKIDLMKFGHNCDRCPTVPRFVR